jgi:hypothetical protein
MSFLSAGKKLTKNFFYGDESDNLANNKGQIIEIFHVPSGAAVAFKAALISFQDMFSSQWDRTEVFGRMDPIPTYKRTTRVVNVSFGVMAASIKEAQLNLEKMSLMEQMMYPMMEGELKESVGDPTVVMTGAPLLKVRMMNWIGDGNFGGGSAEDSGLLGWIDNLNFVPKLELGVFEGETILASTNNIYPKGFDISFNLNVVHQEVIGWKKTDSWFGEGANFTKDRFPYGGGTLKDQVVSKVSNALGGSGGSVPGKTDQQKEAAGNKITGE